MSEETKSAGPPPQLDPSKGGHARAEKLSGEQRRKIATKAAEARWGKPKATHEGELTIGDASIPCAVIEGGIRVISQRGMSAALGRHVTGSGPSKQKAVSDASDGVAKLPNFLGAGNLKQFIDIDLAASLTEPVEYVPQHGGRTAYGFKAELFPRICDVWLKAKDAGVLTESQKQTADKAYLLMRALAHVAIIALVDEATGYQEVRDRKALQAILDAYLRKEFATWAKRFPDEFYKEIFRLRKWEWRGMKINRPQCVASYTKDLVYARLAPGVLEELEARNPKDDNGNRKARHHQWLTEDVGHPALAQHLYGIIGLMRSADTWDQLMRRADRAYPKRGSTVQLTLFPDSDD
jgi:hypothetical protein